LTRRCGLVTPTYHAASAAADSFAEGAVRGPARRSPGSGSMPSAHLQELMLGSSAVADESYGGGILRLIVGWNLLCFRNRKPL
jgi:hypothetical protein